MTGRVGERGQVTIPKALRVRLGIRPGSYVEFDEDDGRVVIRKADDDPVAAVYGILEGLGETDAFIAALRDPE